LVIPFPVDKIGGMKSGWVLRPGAAEFPHENALINRGTLWIGTALCSAETALATSAPAAEPEVPSARTKTKNIGPRGASKAPPEAPPISRDDPPQAATVTAPPIPRDDSPRTVAAVAPPPSGESRPALGANASPVEGAEGGAAQPTQIDQFVRAIAEVARAHGAADAAAHVESLFKFGTPAPIELSDLARDALFDGNILEPSEEGVHATDWFARTSSAWQKMLRGEAENLAVCGESTLDGWTADLIARLVAKPAMASAIRRDLRRRGIAAFGMLDS
jgi:hypothetical protein